MQASPRYCERFFVELVLLAPLVEVVALVELVSDWSPVVAEVLLLSDWSPA